MAQKKMTIETLADMINEGFKSTATKEDVKALEDRVTTRLDQIKSCSWQNRSEKSRIWKRG
jgi:hypothetical protein